MLAEYPAIPILGFISSTLLLLVLLTSIERRSWNFGLTVLSFCICVENFFGSIETIIWRNDAEIRYYGFCDFISHWQMFTSVVKPAATLVITRSLHNIACMRSLEKTARQKRFEVAFNVLLLIVIPALVAGPIYYIHQGYRFIVFEGYGCTNTMNSTIFELLTVQSWRTLFPLYSVCVYCPRILWTFWKQNRSVNRFLASNGEVSRSRFLRVLAIGSLDIVITLPQGIVNTVNTVLVLLQDQKEHLSIWYPGWKFVHTNWDPKPITLEYLWSTEIGSVRTSVNYDVWTSLLFAFAIFALFGLTKAARESYWRVTCRGAKLFGYDLASRASERPMLSSIVFGRRTRRTETSGAGTQFTIFVDVASAVRRNPPIGDAEAGRSVPHHSRASLDESEYSDTASTLPSYRSSYDSSKTPSPCYELVTHRDLTSSFSSLTPSYHTSPIEPPSPVHLSPTRP
ncbi:unnamed protein product [Peniophora sp. CBMAI 1063]|nr:unnamed protein product [Peniophora sp. CBMAI 1063]